MGDDKNAEAVFDLLEAQVAAQGAGVVRCKEGYMFLFSKATLEYLFAAMEANGRDRALVMVRKGVEA